MSGAQRAKEGGGTIPERGIVERQDSRGKCGTPQGTLDQDHSISRQYGAPGGDE